MDIKKLDFRKLNIVQLMSFQHHNKLWKSNLIQTPSTQKKIKNLIMNFALRLIQLRKSKPIVAKREIELNESKVDKFLQFIEM